MMQSPDVSTQEQIRFTRSIKGAAASVLLALHATGRPMTNRELQHWTAYGDENVTEATRLLTALGLLIAQAPFGWSLAARPVTRLPNPRTLASDISGTPSDNSGTGSDFSGTEANGPAGARSDLSGTPSDISGTGSDFSGTDADGLVAAPSDFSGTSSDISGTPSDNSGSGSDFSGTASSLDSRNLDSRNLDLEKDLDLEAERLVQVDIALRAVGIHEPAASELKRLPNLTAESILSTVEGARDERNPLGAAIYRLKHGWYGARRRHRSRDGRNSKPAEESSRSVDHEAILGESVGTSPGSSRGPLGYDQKRVEEQFRRWVEGE